MLLKPLTIQNMIFRNIWLAKPIEKDAGVKFGVGVTSIFLREGRGGEGGGGQKENKTISRIQDSTEKLILWLGYFSVVNGFISEYDISWILKRSSLEKILKFSEVRRKLAAKLKFLPAPSLIFSSFFKTNKNFEAACATLISYLCSSCSYCLYLSFLLLDMLECPMVLFEFILVPP